MYVSGGSAEDHVGGKKKDRESDGRLQPALLLMSENITEMVREKCPFLLLFFLPPEYNDIIKEQCNSKLYI